MDCFSTWCLISVALVWDQLSWSTVMCKLRACGCTESFTNSCQVQECQQEKILVISRDQVVDRYLAVFLTLGFELNTLETLVVGNKSWWIHSSLLAIFSSLMSSYSPQTFALYSVNFKGHTKITILTTLHIDTKINYHHQCHTINFHQENPRRPFHWHSHSSQWQLLRWCRIWNMWFPWAKMAEVFEPIPHSF